MCTGQVLTVRGPRIHGLLITRLEEEEEGKRVLGSKSKISVNTKLLKDVSRSSILSVFVHRSGKKKKKIESTKGVFMSAAESDLPPHQKGQNY
jgi:hypothetical protein